MKVRRAEGISPHSFKARFPSSDNLCDPEASSSNAASRSARPPGWIHAVPWALWCTVSSLMCRELRRSTGGGSGLGSWLIAECRCISHLSSSSFCTALVDTTLSPSLASNLSLCSGLTFSAVRLKKTRQVELGGQGRISGAVGQVPHTGSGRSSWSWCLSTLRGWNRAALLSTQNSSGRSWLEAGSIAFWKPPASKTCGSLPGCKCAPETPCSIAWSPGTSPLDAEGYCPGIGDGVHTQLHPVAQLLGRWKSGERMIHLMWASLWSFLTVTPVSGRVKYTPGTAMGRGFFGLKHLGAWGLQPPIQSSFSSKFLSRLALNGILCWGPGALSYLCSSRLWQLLQPSVHYRWVPGWRL